MRYQFDHDYHIHSFLSTCAHDPAQTPERILQYAKENRLARICLTNHYWDSAVPGASKWYAPQNYDHIAQELPLPTDESVSFAFGCESDMMYDTTLGIPPARFDDFSFIIIPTTHLHMTGFTISEEDAKGTNARRAALWVERLEALLNAPLPFHKIGVAHLAATLIKRESHEDYLDILRRIPEDDMERLFSRAASLGCGIEINQADMTVTDAEAETVLRMFRIAKSCGCKFYLGSDSHTPDEFRDTKDIFERTITLLDLRESDKFYFEEVKG